MLTCVNCYVNLYVNATSQRPVKLHANQFNIQVNTKTAIPVSPTHSQYNILQANVYKPFLFYIKFTLYDVYRVNLMIKHDGLTIDSYNGLCTLLTCV